MNADERRRILFGDEKSPASGCGGGWFGFEGLYATLLARVRAHAARVQNQFHRSAHAGGSAVGVAFVSIVRGVQV